MKKINVLSETLLVVCSFLSFIKLPIHAGCHGSVIIPIRSTIYDYQPRVRKA